MAAATTPLSSTTRAFDAALTSWDEVHRRAYDAWKHLGPGKLYILGALDAEALGRLRPYERHPIPGQDRPKTLEEMSIAELTLVVKAFCGRLEGIGQLDRFLRAHHRRVQGLLAATGAVTDVSRHADVELANELRDSVFEAVDVLSRAFGLR